MNKITLNHKDTPIFLKMVNAQLVNCIETLGEDYSERLRVISELRHKVVIRTLSRLKGEDAKRFAKEEFETNQQIVKLAQALLQNAKLDAVKLFRGREAVKKYK